MATIDKNKYLVRLDELLGSLSAEYNAFAIEAAYHSTVNLVGNIYGKTSQQAIDLAQFWKDHPATSIVPRQKQGDQFARHSYLQGILRATKDDLEADLIKDIALAATGSVIGDFIALAKIQLDASYKDSAAVLACAAFEDAMKRKAELLGIETDDKGLSDTVNALKSRAVFRGAQATLMPGLIKLRNNAMHADWEKVRPPEVSSLIGFTEQFLLEHFS